MISQGIISGITGALTGLVSNVVNWFSTKSTNESNEKINERNLDYQTAMTQKQWERDDNAHQREVADLKAAGLSPLAATNGAPTSQALNAPNPIAMQAPQINANEIINSLLESSALEETRRHNMVQEGYEGLQYVNQCEEIKQKALELQIENKKVNEQIKYNAEYLTHIANQLTETKRHNEQEEEIRKLEYETKYLFEEIKAKTGGKCGYKIYSDLTEYEAAFEKWNTDFEEFINQFLSDTSHSHSEAYGENWNGSLSVGTGKGPISGNVGGNIGEGSTGSASESYNISQKQQAEIDRFYLTHPMPIFKSYE